MGWLSFSKTYKHKCPDGGIKIIHKNIDDAFPLMIKELKTNADVSVDVMKHLKGKVKVDFENKIKGLLYDIDELNKDLMIKLRGAYIGFQSDPCKDNGFFQRQVDNIITQQSNLTKWRMQIRGLISLLGEKTDNKKVLETYYAIVNNMGIHNDIIAQKEIAENREAAKNWIKEGQL